MRCARETEFCIVIVNRGIAGYGHGCRSDRDVESSDVLPKGVRVLKISEEEIANNTGGSEIKGDGGIRLEQGVVNISGVTPISEFLVPIIDDKNLRPGIHSRTRIK